MNIVRTPHSAPPYKTWVQTYMYHIAPNIRGTLFSGIDNTGRFTETSFHGSIYRKHNLILDVPQQSPDCEHYAPQKFGAIP